MTRWLCAAIVCWPLGNASLAADATTADVTTVLVLPFENTRQEPRLAWMREGAALLLSDYLEAAGDVAIDRDERIRAFDRLQLPAAAVLSRASSVKVGQAVSAVAVVSGRLELVGAELVAHARVIRLDTGRLLPEVEARGPLADVFEIFRGLAQQLKGAATPPIAVSDRVPPSPQVFELYVKGLIAETPSAELAFLEQVLKAAPQFDRARLAIWQVHTEAGNHLRALDIISRVTPASRLSREARFLGALSMTQLKRYDDALQALRALQTEQRSAAVANAIGVVELRRFATPQPGRATYYFSQATELDPTDGDLFFNLGYAYWQEHDAKAAIYWLREAVRRDPGDGDAHFILSAALQQTGATAEASRERELALRLSSKYASWDAKPAGGDPVPRGLERLDDELSQSAARVDLLITANGQREQDTLAQFHLDSGRRAYEREADREAIDELRRALFLSPYLAEAHLLLGRLFLRGGRTEDAIEALKIALWSEETVAAHVALGEAYLQAEDHTLARAEADRALALDPKSADGLRLKARLGGGPW
ncbi:MAG: tetratricopeptide repeat protein [Vicinamibacterales bacterium]